MSRWDKNVHFCSVMGNIPLPPHMCTRTVRGLEPRHELARLSQGYPPSPHMVGQQAIHFWTRGGASRGRAVAAQRFERSNSFEFAEFAEGGPRNAPQVRLQSPGLAKKAWGCCPSMCGLPPMPLGPRGSPSQLAHSPPGACAAIANSQRIRADGAAQGSGKEACGRAR